MKYVRKIRGVKMLCRLQKNDKWLRFFWKWQTEEVCHCTTTGPGRFAATTAACRRTPLRQVPQFCGIPSCDGTRHDRIGRRPGGVDIPGRGWHSVSGRHPRHIMKNILSLCVALTVVALSVRGADAPKDKTADELWQSIQSLEQAPQPRDRAELLERMGQLHTTLLEFERRFPGDARA